MDKNAADQRSHQRCYSMVGPQHERDSGGEASRMMEEEADVRSRSDHAALQASRRPANLVWREKVCQWSYDVIDHLGASRDIVYLALNVLDRYCVLESSSEIVRDEKAYELAAMTGLFLAVRLSGKGGFGASDITRMSRRGINAQDIVKMAKSMIEKLSWDHRMRTPSNFVDAFVKLLPSSVDNDARRALRESASYLVEIAVCDSFFSRIPPSQVAYAALINALGSDGNWRICESHRSELYKTIHAVTGIERDAPELREVRSRLHHIYSQSEDSTKHVIPETEGDDVVVVLSRPVSMRCVSVMNLPDTCMQAVTETSPPPCIIYEPPSAPPTAGCQGSAHKKRPVSPPPLTEFTKPKRSKRARTY